MAKIKFKWIKCPACNGEGAFEDERDYDHNDLPIVSYVECRVCKGSGKAQEAKSVKEDRNDTQTR